LTTDFSGRRCVELIIRDNPGRCVQLTIRANPDGCTPEMLGFAKSAQPNLLHTSKKTPHSRGF
jgi:hypothetical protein